MTKQKKKVVHLDSDADDMSMDDEEEDSDFDGAPKKVCLPTPLGNWIPWCGNQPLQRQNPLDCLHMDHTSPSYSALTYWTTEKQRMFYTVCS